jgi:hypothetical protein
LTNAGIIKLFLAGFEAFNGIVSFGTLVEIMANLEVSFLGK